MTRHSVSKAAQTGFGFCFCIKLLEFLDFHHSRLCWCTTAQWQDSAILSASLIHFNYHFWQQYSHWDGLQWNNEPHLWGYVVFFTSWVQHNKLARVEVLEGGGGGRGVEKENKQTKMSLLVHVIVWLLIDSAESSEQCRGSFGWLVYNWCSFRRGSAASATPPSSNKGTIRRECLHNQKICLPLCTCCGSSPSLIFGEARTH